jgi:hypothetical protein
MTAWVFFTSGYRGLNPHERRKQRRAAVCERAPGAHRQRVPPTQTERHTTVNPTSARPPFRSALDCFDGHSRSKTRGWHAALGVAAATLALSLASQGCSGTPSDGTPLGGAPGQGIPGLGTPAGGAPSCEQALENNYAVGCMVTANGNPVSESEAVNQCNETVAYTMSSCPACKSQLDALLSCWSGITAQSQCGTCSFAALENCGSTLCSAADGGAESATEDAYSPEGGADSPVDESDSSDSIDEGPPDGGSTSACGFSGFSSASCASCISTSCCSQTEACADDPACTAIVSCLGSCSSGDTTCEDNCVSSGPSTAQTEIENMANCWNSSCAVCD